jgi:hypothetical protein
MSVLKQYNPATSQWEAVVVGKQGPSGTVAVTAPLTNTGTSTAGVLGVDYSTLQYGQNHIINGGFDIWQRGTSFTPVSGYGFGADRWQVFSAGTSTGTMSRQAFTAGAAPVPGYEGTFFMRVRSTNTGTWFKQNIEDVRAFAGQTVTLSFWAKASSSASIGFLPAQDFGTGGSTFVDIAAGSVFDLTTSWARYTRTFTVPSISGKTVGSNSLFRALFYTPTINVDFDIWGVQLEQGLEATPFKRHAPSIQGELAACQRYYQRYLSETAYGHFASGIPFSTTQMVILMPLKVTMRTNPTSIDFGGALAVSDTAILNNISNASMQTDGNSNIGRILVTSSGMTQFRMTHLISNNSTTAFIGFNAELI